MHILRSNTFPCRCKEAVWFALRATNPRGWSLQTDVAFTRAVFVKLRAIERNTCHKAHSGNWPSTFPLSNCNWIHENTSQDYNQFAADKLLSRLLKIGQIAWSVCSKRVNEKIPPSFFNFQSQSFARIDRKPGTEFSWNFPYLCEGSAITLGFLPVIDSRKAQRLPPL